LGSGCCRGGGLAGSIVDVSCCCVVFHLALGCCWRFLAWQFLRRSLCCKRRGFLFNQVSRAVVYDFLLLFCCCVCGCPGVLVWFTPAVFLLYLLFLLSFGYILTCFLLFVSMVLAALSSPFYGCMSFGCSANIRHLLIYFGFVASSACLVLAICNTLLIQKKLLTFLLVSKKYTIVYFINLLSIF